MKQIEPQSTSLHIFRLHADINRRGTNALQSESTFNKSLLSRLPGDLHGNGHIGEVWYCLLRCLTCYGDTIRLQKPWKLVHFLLPDFAQSLRGPSSTHVSTLKQLSARFSDRIQLAEA